MDSNLINEVADRSATSLSQLFLSVDHNISLAEAVDMTKRYETQIPVLMSGGLVTIPNVMPLTETFNSADIQELLEQPDTAGMRMYLGMDSVFKIRLILVSAFDDGTDPIMNHDANLPIKEHGQRDPS
jgi:hypothetical protein